jgi:hypothetical protein
MTVFNRITQHKIQYGDWPVDCLARYLDKKQRLLLSSIAPKIIASIDSVNITQSRRSACLQQLDDYITSSVNRLVIQMARQDQNLAPYVNHLMVAMERGLPINVNLFSVVYDCMDQLKQDHVIQRRIFDLINMTVKDFQDEDQMVFYPQLFSAIQLFETELFHILDIQLKVLFPKICRLTSR